MDANGFNGAVTATKSAIGIAMGTIYGPAAKAFSEAMLGNPAILSQLAAMGEKNELGTLSSADYATLLKIITDYGLGIAVVGGATISIPISVLWTLTGIGLAIYQNRNNIEDFWNKLNDLQNSGQENIDGDPFTGMPWPGVDSAVNTQTTNAMNWVPRRDPLVLDLDGGGITTSAINPNAPIYFDQDGDGTRTATGWIAAGEAIVVRDLNGNGLIDSGRELFGDNTILTHGPRAGQTATNGFEALADMDSNLDGKFDARDADFASVKLWKDRNQDGVSQSDELFTFAQNNIWNIEINVIHGVSKC
jgi:hypothetical protein